MATPRKPTSASVKQEEASSPMMSPPAHVPGGLDPAFIWQQLANIQNSLGSIQEGQRQLATQVEKVETKLDKMEERVSGITHKLYAAGVVLAIALAVGGFAVSKAWDLMAAQIIESKK